MHARLSLIGALCLLPAFSIAQNPPSRTTTPTEVVAPPPTATSSSVSIAPAPTESIGCVQHDDHWHCEGPATPTQAGAATGVQSDIPPPPTESVGCVLHEDHYHCSGPADSASAEDGHDDHGEEVISDSDTGGCVQHGNHFHCPPGVTASCEFSIGSYDQGIRIMALFILLVASGVGVYSPVVAGRFAAKGRTSGVLRWAILAMKHFGTGVILSTALIHLLFHAFVMFANECIGHLAYEPTGAAIAMASLLCVFAINFIAARVIARRRRSALAVTSQSGSMDSGDVDDKSGGARIESVMAVQDQNKLQLTEVEALEAGIIFHSIMIGISLGTQGDTGFIPLFCAIIFHQMFEGFGLGARLALVQGHATRKFLLALAYTVTTPIGIAIGIGIRQGFNPQAPSFIIAVGVLNSISAGILLYAAIAQLLVGDWLVGPLLGGCHSPAVTSRTGTVSGDVDNGHGPLRDAPLSVVLVAAISLLLGAFALALIGKWA